MGCWDRRTEETCVQPHPVVAPRDRGVTFTQGLAGCWLWGLQGLNLKPLETKSSYKCILKSPVGDLGRGPVGGRGTEAGGCGRRRQGSLGNRDRDPNGCPKRAWAPGWDSGWEGALVASRHL